MKNINLLDCFREFITQALSQIFGLNTDRLNEYWSENKLVFTKTPSSELGDYGLALHSLFHSLNIDRSQWSEYGSRLIDFLEKNNFYEKCFVNKALYVNGYINLFIDYARLFINIAESIINGSFYCIKEYGRGQYVVVEHTSANPVHPLHIGSGRNSVIGDTYARLLEYLGFKVNKRFYVNDMGRQVATLVYGYSKLIKHGVKPDPLFKIDHWYGIVYALTNILIEKNRLLFNLNKKLIELKDLLNNLNKDLEKMLIDTRLYKLIDLLISVERVYYSLEYVSDIVCNLNKLLNELRDIVDSTTDIGLKESINKQYVLILRNHREIVDLLNELNDYLRAESRLAYLNPNVYSILSSEIVDYETAEREINELMYKYEYGDSNTSILFKKTIFDVLQGFDKTLRELGITIDNYDFESGEPGCKYLNSVIEGLLKTNYVETDGSSITVDLDKASLDYVFIKELFGQDQPGKVVVRRSDGTTLYVTRDIAYSIYKTRDLGASRVYNVIASEQLREQKQVKSILYILGYSDVIDKIIHFSYEMVSLKDTRMSGRRGEYLTLDELVKAYMDIIITKYVENQLKLGIDYFSEDYSYYRDIVYKLSIACTRALLLSVDPSKPLVFDYRRLEDYDIGAWIIYTFVRLQSILRRAFNIEPLDNPEYYLNLLRELISNIRGYSFEIIDIEKNIIEKITLFQQMLIDAYMYLKPNKILEYTRDLCSYLNKLYESLPILNERDFVKKSFRIGLVIVSLLVLRDLMKIMGLPEIKKI
ncbi:MAG: arginine--tRNA ligase [Desulfurococcaceae archaeon]